MYALDSAVVEVQEILYFGHTFAPDGLMPSSDKLRAIMEIRGPQNRTEIQRCMCTVNYLRKFIPNQLGINQMLRQFLQKKMLDIWRKLSSKALMSPKELQLLSVDNSKDALGACILQNGHPNASKSLNK